MTPTIDAVRVTGTVDDVAKRVGIIFTSFFLLSAGFWVPCTEAED